MAVSDWIVGGLKLCRLADRHSPYLTAAETTAKNDVRTACEDLFPSARSSEVAPFTSMNAKLVAGVTYADAVTTFFGVCTTIACLNTWSDMQILGTSSTFKTPAKKLCDSKDNTGVSAQEIWSPVDDGNLEDGKAYPQVLLSYTEQACKAALDGYAVLGDLHYAATCITSPDSALIESKVELMSLCFDTLFSPEVA